MLLTSITGNPNRNLNRNYLIQAEHGKLNLIKCQCRLSQDFFVVEAIFVFASFTDFNLLRVTFHIINYWRVGSNQFKAITLAYRNAT